MHRIIEFEQESLLKPYIDMNAELKVTQSDIEKWFFTLMNSASFEKTMKNVREHWDIKLGTTEAKRNYLGSEPNYHTTIFFFFFENFSFNKKENNTDNR